MGNKNLLAVHSKNIVADLPVHVSAFDEADYIVTYSDDIAVTE